MANTHSLDLELSSSQYAEIADGSQTGLDLSGDFTFEIWVKFESLPADTEFRQFYNKGDEGASAKGYRFFLGNEGGQQKIQIEINQTADNTTRDLVKWNWSPSTGVWYHLAITCDVSNATATTFELFIGDQSTNPASQGNGTPAISGNASSINNNNKPFTIGAYLTSAAYSRFMDGLMNSCRVFSDIRTSTEIVDNYKTDTPAGDNLQGRWFTDNTYNDGSGNNNTLTATGSPVFSTDVPYGGAVARAAGWAFII